MATPSEPAGASSSEPQAGDRVADVTFTDELLVVRLADGRVISAPLASYPRLLQGSAAERRNWIIGGGGFGIHWPELDEDLTVQGLLRGYPAPQASGSFR